MSMGSGSATGPSIVHVDMDQGQARTPVQEQVDRLEEGSKRLGDQLNSLVKRLGPVLVRETPEPVGEGSGAKDMPPLSPLEERLYVLANDLESMSRFVVTTVNRLRV